jgi:hypothetical protein
MGFLNKIFGDKVKVPKFKEIDPDAEIQKAFDSIQEQLPEAQRITKDIGEADADTALAVLERIAPGTQQVIQQQVSNLQAGLRGELPEDVQRAITDRAAARSVGGGFGGSQFGRNLELRDLGLTSLQRIDTAMGQSAQALAQYSSMVPRTSVSSMFMSPSDRIAFAQGERNMQYQRDYAAAQERAKADPVTKGMAQVAAKVAGSAIGAAVGGPAGAQAGSEMGGSMFGGGGGGGGGIPFRSGYTPYRSPYTLPDGYTGPQMQPSGQPGFFKRFLGNIGQSMG